MEGNFFTGLTAGLANNPNPRKLSRGVWRNPRRSALRDDRMTVCAACLFRWNSGDGEPDYGPAILAASDRMLTDAGLGIQYEGTLQKRVWLAPSVMGLVAGNVGYHTAVIARVVAAIAERELKLPSVIADEFARQMREYTADRAEQQFLAPFRLTIETFLGAQKNLDSDLVRDLNRSLIDFASTVEFEALIIGMDAQKGATLASINQFGILTPHMDIGFAAIGAGGTHAAAHFMQSQFSRNQGFYPALWRTFCAKKRAEVAPGIGRQTDVIVVNRTGHFDVSRALIDLMEEAYKAQEKERLTKSDEVVRTLIDSEIGLCDPVPGQVGEAADAEKDDQNKPPGEQQEEIASKDPEIEPAETEGGRRKIKVKQREPEA